MFQGDVMSISSKKPHELTALFEEISGSGQLKEDYERLKAEKGRAEEDAKVVFDRLRQVKTERKQLRDQKEEAEA